MATTINVIDTSGIRPEDFAVVRDFVAGCHRPGWYPVDGMMPFRCTGRRALYLGQVVLRLRGWIVCEEGCTWRFTGAVSCNDDTYDFDKAKRDALAEIFTAVGRQLSGTPFKIKVRGSKPLTGGGRCCQGD